MSKKVVLIAGVLLAVGSAAAISSPYLRGAQLRIGELLADFRDDGSGSRPGRSGKRHREIDADDESQIGREDFARSRHARLSRPNRADDAEDAPMGDRERGWRRSRDRLPDRSARADEPGDDARKGGAPERRAGRAERQFARLDRNGDGFIDAKELEVWATERAARAAQHFVKRFDADGDGKVSRDEFRQFIKHRQIHREGDADDSITEAELAPARPGRGILE